MLLTSRLLAETVAELGAPPGKLPDEAQRLPGKLQLHAVLRVQNLLHFAFIGAL